MQSFKELRPVRGARAALVKEKDFELLKSFENRWMIVDEDGQELTLENTPSLANIELGLDDSHLTIAVTGRFFRLALATEPKRTTMVREKQCLLEPDLYSQIISQCLAKKVSLCRLPSVNPQGTI